MLRVGMPMSLTYATDLFDESTVVSFAERFGSGSGPRWWRSLIRLFAGCAVAR